MFSKAMYYVGLGACIGIVLSCLMPWIHINSLNQTFTGFNVTKFPTGNNYGRAGKVISILSAVIFILMLIPKIWAKRANIFTAALLFAYCIRTYIIFTGALFDGEVEKLAGIYLIVVLSFIIMIGTGFPKMKEGEDYERGIKKHEL